MLKVFIKYIATIFALAFLGYTLIVLAYLIPQDNIEKNLHDGFDHMAEMGITPQIVQGYKSTQLDYYTDYIKLAITSYDGDENVFVKAAKNFRIGNTYGQTEKVEYGWYWHGYIIFLKPIFFFMTYWDFKVVNIMLSIGSVIVTVYLLMKHGFKEFVPPYFLALVIINPIVVALSFQFSPCYYVMHLVLCYLIIYGNKRKVEIPLVFFIGGILVTYFDLLTYPLVVYGVPIAFVAHMMMTEHEKISDIMKKILVCGVTFILGYGLMFVSKFIIGWIITDGDIVSVAVEHILLRMSGNGLENDIRRIDAIYRNVQVFAHLPYCTLFAIVLIIAVVRCLIGIRKQGVKGLLYLLSCAFIFILPFVWYFVLANHSHIHYFFTSRALAVSAAALGMLATSEVHQDS